jgi:hypothetical protein
MTYLKKELLFFLGLLTSLISSHPTVQASQRITLPPSTRPRRAWSVARAASGAANALALQARCCVCRSSPHPRRRRRDRQRRRRGQGGGFDEGVKGFMLQASYDKAVPAATPGQTPS